MLSLCWVTTSGVFLLRSRQAHVGQGMGMMEVENVLPGEGRGQVTRCDFFRAECPRRKRLS
jgi:hypothetical protein